MKMWQNLKTQLLVRVLQSVLQSQILNFLLNKSSHLSNNVERFSRCSYFFLLSETENPDTGLIQWPSHPALLWHTQGRCLTCLRGLIRTKEPVSLLSQEGRRKGLCFHFIWIIRIYIIKLVRVWETKRKQRSYLDFEVSAIGSEKLSFLFFFPFLFLE